MELSRKEPVTGGFCGTLAANEREKDDGSRISFKKASSFDMHIKYGISACTPIMFDSGKVVIIGHRAVTLLMHNAFLPNLLLTSIGKFVEYPVWFLTTSRQINLSLILNFY
jgi:hypothetical protein